MRRVEVPSVGFLGLLALKPLIEHRDSTKGHYKRTRLKASDSTTQQRFKA